MTVIVGVVDGDRVWIGGDSQSSDDHVGTARLTPKVFRSHGMLMGVCGDSRVSQIVQYVFEPPGRIEDASDPMHYLVGTFMPALHEAISAPGVEHQNGDHKSRWSILLAVQGRLFAIYDDFQVEETRDGFNAIGCGYRTALGSLHTTDPSAWNGQRLYEGESRVRMALEATAHIDLHVCGPFVVEAA